MNDPRLLNDLVANALDPVKRIYAARLKLQDETASMTSSEKIAYLNQKTLAFLAPSGRKLCNLTN
jgi:hypothetical protein